MSSHEEEKVAVGVAAQRAAVESMVQASPPLFALMVAGILVALNTGVGAARPWFIVGGAVISAVTMFLYCAPNLSAANGRPARPWFFAAVLSGFIPYLYALYIILYEGVWRAFERGFTASGLFVSAVFVGLGYWYLRRFATVTEVSKEIGRIADVQYPGARRSIR